MHSYGYIYLDLDIDMLDSNAIADMIWPDRNNKKKRADELYQKGMKLFQALNKRDPDDYEKESMKRTFEFIINEENSPLELMRAQRFTKIAHETFSLGNVAQYAKKLSIAYCCRAFSMAGYDEDVFQLCSFDKGTSVIVHQIGEMLEDVNLKKHIGKAKDVSALFHIAPHQAQVFINIRDVFDAEDFITNILESTP